MQSAPLLFRRASGGTLRRMRRNIQAVHDEFGQSRLLTALDMAYCMTQGFGHLDYLTFGFAQIRGSRRRTFMTMGDNIALARRLNDRRYLPTFQDKLLFDQAFRPFLGRAYMDLRDGLPQFLCFMQCHPVIFAKQPTSFGGKGVRRVEADADVRQAYDSLLSQGYYLAEEAIEQHPDMRLLCGSCVNTLRVVTVVGDGGGPRVVYTLLRVGCGENAVDNISAGGMYTMPDADGRIVFPMFCDRAARYYDRHPKTGFAFRGFCIPFFSDSQSLCLRAALVQPHVRYVGWDVAVTPDGPVLIEGNPLPGYDMCQNYRFHTDGRGMKRAFEAALDEAQF